MDKTGWTKVKLGDIAELKNGYSFKSSDYDINKDGTYKIVTIKNVTGEQFISEDNYETVSFLPTNIRNHQILKKGDILISMTGNVGRVSLVRGDNYLLNQRVGLIQIKSKSIVSELYLNQVLSGQDFESTMISRGHGAAQPNIGKDDIESYELYLPPMEIQLQIAKLLTTIDNIIQSKSDESTKYQNMKTQIMNDIFNNGEREQHWAKVKLKDAVTINPKTKVPDRFLYMDLECVKSGCIVRDMNELEKDEAPSRAKRLLSDNDIMYQTTRPYQRNNFWFKDIYELPVVASTGYAQLRVINNVAGYIYQVIHTDDFVKDVMNRCTGGAYPAINPTELGEIEIPLPPIEQQTLIANLLTMYDDVIETVNKEKEDYEKIKTQMMNMIFA